MSNLWGKVALNVNKKGAINSFYLLQYYYIRTVIKNQGFLQKKNYFYVNMN